MAKRKEILDVVLRATNTEIDNVLEGVALYRDANYFYAYANSPIPRSSVNEIIKLLEARFPRDLAFVNDAFAMLTDRTSVEALVAVLKAAKDKSDMKRRALLDIARSILVYLQTR